MEPQAIAKRRVDGDRINYLEETIDGFTWNHLTLVRRGVKACVLTWLDRSPSTGTVTLGLGYAPFNFQEALHPAEARLLAQALLMAADDAEQAAEAEAAAEAAEADGTTAHDQTEVAA